MKVSLLLLALASFLTPLAHAETPPPCLDRYASRELPVDNSVVGDWKDSKPNGFRARAHVDGTVTKVYPDREDVQNYHSNHHHFQLSLRGGDTVEIVFNEDFGDTPPIQTGMKVEACGDFINSFAANDPYPASPDGAILHWVHVSQHLDRHQSGYLAIDGRVYGTDLSGQ